MGMIFTINATCKSVAWSASGLYNLSMKSLISARVFFGLCYVFARNMTYILFSYEVLAELLYNRVATS